MKGIRAIAAGLLAAASLSLSGCALFGSTDGMTKNPLYSYDYSSMELVQLREPTEGQPTADIETTVGTIKVVLYPEYAPNTVSNFVNRANEGYYNGKDVYYVLDKSIFMTGSLDEKRNSGVTEDGELIANEYSVDLWPFRGALCSFNGRTGYGDSRFFVLNKRDLTEQEISDLREFKNENDEKLLPDELIDAFIEKGVIIDFCGGYTIFAQTYEGFDVIEKICDSEVVGEFSTPKEPVYINRITISTYHSD